MKKFWILLAGFLFLTSCKSEAMILTSTAFQNEGEIPSKYTCDGENVSPELELSGVPLNTESLALIVDDPDAPAGTWVHWVVWNIDPKTTVIPEGALLDAVDGVSSFGTTGYGGPCPPSGTHRYYFRLYALDTELEIISSDANRTDLDKAMGGHILEEATLMGIYKRI